MVQRRGPYVRNVMLRDRNNHNKLQACVITGYPDVCRPLEHIRLSIFARNNVGAMKRLSSHCIQVEDDTTYHGYLQDVLQRTQ